MRQIISFNNKNVILPEPWVPSGPANDEIWYTSSDGNIVTPSDTTGWPSIVSNTYVNGKGIIKFASDITNVVRAAFYGDNKLNSIVIPNSVTRLEEWSFGYTHSLSYLKIPSSVIYLGLCVLRSCYSLDNITYTGTISQWNNITKSSSWYIEIKATVVHCTDGDVAI